MREYKFKAFYKPLKKMIQPEQLESINFDTKIVGIYMPHEGRGYHKFRLSDFIIMQYTGLKDSKGKEIYEGDIWESEYGKTYVIEFDEECAGYLPFVSDDGCGCCSGDGTRKKAVSGVIIGNRWDNPQPLKVRE